MNNRYRLTATKPSATGIKSRIAGFTRFANDLDAVKATAQQHAKEGYTVTILDLITYDVITVNPE